MIQWSKSNFIFLKNKSLSMLMVAFSLLCAGISAAELTQLMVNQEGFSAPEKLGVLNVFKDKEDYFVLTKSGLHKVHKHDVSPLLRKMSDEQLTQFLNEGNGLLKVGQFDNGEFRIDRHVYGKGGGPVGATVGVIVGKGAVYGVSYGLIHLVGLCTGPFYPATVGALTGVLAAPIEAASITAAAVVGMAGAVATGPV